MESARRFRSEINLKGDEFTARNQSGRQITGRKP
jgi:hypothetical protein